MIMFLIVGDVKSEPRNNTAGLRVNIHKQVQLIGQQIRMRIFLHKTRSLGRFVSVALPDHFRPYFKKLSSVPLPPVCVVRLSLPCAAAPHLGRREREDEAAGNRNSCGRSFPCDRHVLACVCA